MARVRVRLLASLAEAAGTGVVEVEAGDWREALLEARRRLPGLSRVVGESGEPMPGYLVFVDGVDYRVYDGEGAPREVVILPVNHGGGVDVEFVDWGDIEEAVATVSSRIEESGFRPDVIIGIIRGGLVPARLVADRIGVDEIATMDIKLYKGVGLRGERPYLRQPPLLDLFNKRVLIVDDVSDTGLTLQLAVEAVNLYMPAEVRTATLYIKPWTDFVPDYYAVSTRSWIVFPWERGEYEREAGES